MLVSLLPAEESDRLLRAVHALLPPVVDGTIALLRPPEPHLGDAALGLADAEILIIRKADHEGLAASDAADERHLVWCRDDIEAAGIPAGMGTAVVAESLEALAWELVRRLSGDLSPGGHAQPAAMSHMSGVSDDIARSRESGEASSTAATSPQRRNGRVPAPPAWARGVLPGNGPIADADVQTSREPEPASGPPIPDHRPPFEQTGAHASRLPVTPLAALAGVGSDQPYRTASDDSPFGALETQDAANHHLPAHGGSRLRTLIGRVAPSRPRLPAPDLAGLGQVLLRAHSTVVTVGTPKGGPGKTTEAAAIGVLGARAVEPHGGSAVLVDANLNNPDSWRQLAVPTDALTVREVVEALNRGALVPNGEFARNERLRVLPERRSAGSAYTAAEIDRLVTHLRLRHTLVVVDLPNTLPSLSEGAKEAWSPTGWSTRMSRCCRSTSVRPPSSPPARSSTASMPWSPAPTAVSPGPGSSSPCCSPATGAGRSSSRRSPSSSTTSAPRGPRSSRCRSPSTCRRRATGAAPSSAPRLEPIGRSRAC
jgi:hypothetical protein